MSFCIGDRHVGPGEPAFLVAEMSGNHLQDFDLAVRIIREAGAAGADAVKLQTYTPDTMTLDCAQPCFAIHHGTPWDGRTLYDLYGEAQTPWEWLPKLKEVAEREGLVCFSTSFDPTAVDFNEKMRVPAHKIASFEITDIPLIEYAASKGKPVILSTGIASLGDIDLAVCACRRMENEQIILLKCTSAYPAPVNKANLLTIPNLAETFGVVAGLSDHSLSTTVPVGAVALGACVVEKHLTLDRGAGGPDAAFSLEPREFRQMAEMIREFEEARGRVTYELDAQSRKNREFARSLFITEEMGAGEPFTEANVRSIRPAYGLHPRYYSQILGKHARRDIRKGTPLSWDLIEGVRSREP